MNKTALDELIQWINHDTKPIECIYKAKELLEKEKQQIINAVLFSRDQNFNIKEAEDYFKKKYTILGQYENYNEKSNKEI